MEPPPPIRLASALPTLSDAPRIAIINAIHNFFIDPPEDKRAGQARRQSAYNPDSIQSRPIGKIEVFLTLTSKKKDLGTHAKSLRWESFDSQKRFLLWK
jgi:hypothetical protein